MLANWRATNEDCCKWVGVFCDDLTGHVTELQLGGTSTNILGGKLNLALLDLKYLSYLDLSDNDFDTTLPGWFWSLTSHLRYLNISGNQFQGKIPDLLINHAPYLVLDLSSNSFSGSLPGILLNVTILDLSNNAFSGSITRFLCHRKHRMKVEVLNLNDNLLSGEIPNCWEKWPNLVAIKLSNNNFSGKIPSSMGTLTSLQSLHLLNNNLVGQVPSSLRNCSELLTVDFGANQLSGEIPSWIGQNLSKLVFISLQANLFRGPIPKEFCALSSLQILVLSRNNLSGNIPRCISNLTAMISRGKSDGQIAYNTSKGSIFDSVQLMMKGVVSDYSSTLKLIKLVDLSDNNLSGEIPEEMTNLIGLLSLNLSKNHLVGKIPGTIGAMNSLECVDLSENNLSGQIPLSMCQLTFLSYLNLSYNNLTGKIPSGTQLQSFSSSSFLGTKLYGPPLTNGSDISKTLPGISNTEGENPLKVNWFLISTECGFLFGFMCVSAAILLTTSWDSLI